MTLRLTPKQRWKIACQNKLAWTNVALTLLTGAIFVNADNSDVLLRGWSLVLQLMGAYIVLRDLSGAAKDFGASGIIEGNKRWFKAVFLGKPTDISVSADLTSGVSATVSIGQVRVAVDHNASIDERFAQLERYVDAVSDAATQAVTLINAKERELYQKIRGVRQDLEKSLAVTNDRVKQAMIGNYSMLFFGGWWVAVGSILSTFAPEVPKFLTGNWGFSPMPLDNIDILKFRYFVSLMAS